MAVETGVGAENKIVKRSSWVELLTGVAEAEVLAVKKTGVASQKSVRGVLTHFFDDLAAMVRRGERVIIPGFGVFAPSIRRARKGRHPVTGEVIQLPAVKTIRFRPHKGLRE